MVVGIAVARGWRAGEEGMAEAREMDVAELHVKGVRLI